jgi:HlyD family secretion protein
MSALSERVRSLQLPQEVESQGFDGRRLAWLLCLVLAGTTLAFGYLAFRQQRAASKAAGASPTATSSAGDKTATAEAVSPESDIALESKGYVVPAQQILVSPKVSGMITRLSIREGLRVKKGEILAQLEDTDYQADHARATAALELAKQALLELERGNRPEEIAQAREELAESEAQLTEAEAQYKRSTELHNRNVLSQQDFDTAESRYRAMLRRVERLRYALKLMEKGPREERIAMARAQVQQSEAELAKAKWKLDNCTIHAPISGTILKKNAEEGNIVNPIAFNGSFSLCDMADLANLEVDLSIQERDIAQIFPGQKCKIRAEAFPNRVYQGVVSRLMPIADRAKGAIPVRVQVVVPAEEEGVYLKPEMGVIVSFLTRGSADAKR